MADKKRAVQQYEEKIRNICDKNTDKPYLSTFVNYLMASEKSYSTIFNYIFHIADFLNELNKPIEEITMDDYTSYMLKHEELTSSYRIVKYTAISSFSKYLFCTEKIRKDFMANVARPKFIETQKTVEKREKGFLTANEIQQLLRNIENGIGNEKSLWFQHEYRARDMAIVMVFLTTGIRESALCNMDVEDIDFENNMIIVTDKGDKVNTHIIPSETKKILKIWLEKRTEILTKAKRTKETALFISNEKKRISVGAVRNIVKKYSSTITGKNITPHKLRATYATMLYNATKDIEFVRGQMNHSSVVTTQRYIRGNGKANKQKAADIMSELTNSKNRYNHLIGETDD